MAKAQDKSSGAVTDYSRPRDIRDLILRVTLPVQVEQSAALTPKALQELYRYARRLLNKSDGLLLNEPRLRQGISKTVTAARGLQQAAITASKGKRSANPPKMMVVSAKSVRKAIEDIKPGDHWLPKATSSVAVKHK